MAHFPVFSEKVHRFDFFAPRPLVFFFCLHLSTMAPSKKAAAALDKIKPSSAFATGKYKGDSPLKPGKKDVRHLLFVLGLCNGIVLAWLKKYNLDQEPFLNYDYQLLNDSPATMEDLGINAVVHRKGADGATAMTQTPTSTYNWRQMVLIIGEDSNTATARRELADRLIAHFNNNANTANYQYPRKVRFGSDLTGRVFRPADHGLLDIDVLGLMMAAYPTTPLEELATFDDIMSTFWTNIERGREVMAAHVAGQEGADDNDENDDDDSDDSDDE